MVRTVTLAITLLLAATSVVAAAPQATATRCEEAPKIDGQLADACWQLGAWSDDFSQRDPVEGAPPSENTRFAVRFDDAFVYVALEAQQSAPIIGYLSRRDSTSPSDWLTVSLGSAGDQRHATSFSTNPAGVRVDHRHFDDTGTDFTWDGLWDVATSVDSDQWRAEFRIPLSQLSFDEQTDIWDLQVERTIAARHEVIQWTLVSKEDSGVVSRWGRLNGVNEIEAPLRFEVVPYLLGGLRLTRPQDATFGAVKGLGSAGADITYGITGDITASATINPDFGQVEGDPAEINLSAFETRFAERRPFFVETNNDLQLDGPEFFYSRRIGRPPQGRPPLADDEESDIPTQTTVLGAATLRGRAGDTTFALLNALTAPMSARIESPNGERREIAEPLTNFVVGRVQRTLRGGQSSFGTLFTAMNRNVANRDFLVAQLRSEAFAGAVDVDHRWAANEWRLSALGGFSSVFGSAEAIQRTQRSSARYYQRPDASHVRVDPTRTSLDGWTGKLQLARETGAVIGAAGVEAKSPGFEINDAGFLSSTDKIATWAEVSVRDLDPGSVLRSWSVGPRIDADWTFGGERTGLEADLNASVQWLNYWTSDISASHSFPEYCTNCTRGGPIVRRPYGDNFSAGFGTDGRRPFIASANGWIFSQTDSNTTGSGVGAAFTYRPTQALEFGLEPSHSWFDDGWMWVDEADQRYTFANLVTHTTRLTLRANVTLSPEMSLELWAQPLIGSGQFSDYMNLAYNRSPDFDRVFADVDNIERGDGAVALDENGDGISDFFVSDGDFLVGSHRNTMVYRWEWRRGSSIFLVWQHRRDHFLGDGRYQPLKALGSLYGKEASQEHVVMLKLTHWLGY